MRYALRNQQKIEKALSVECLNRIVLSLKQHFSGRTEIEAKEVSGEPYPVLTIENASGGSAIEFYLTGRKYDVFRLAFKGFVY